MISSPIVDRMAEAHARAIRRALAMESLPFFATNYFLDDDGGPIILEQFQSDLLNDAASDEPDMDKQLQLHPAGHGKTTLIGIIYPIWRMIRNRNSRIMLMGKTFDDAKARVRSIKAELEGNEALIGDFGPFVTEKWTDSELNIAGRTTRSKESTITAVGSETNIFGARATDFIGDDLVTIENSGPQVTDATRSRLKENFNQGVRKLGVPRCRIRWINTVVDLRDLCHETMRVSGSIPPESVTRWRSDRGWLIVRRLALNESTGETLWPRMFTREMLEAERAEDPVAFNKRRQNRCVEPGMMSFQHDWFVGNPALGMPGCMDHSRIFGQHPAGSGWVGVGGFDPTAGQTATSKWCGWVEAWFDSRIGPDEPCEFVITEISRFRLPVEAQADFIIRRVGERHLYAAVIEANGAHQYLMQLNAIRRARSAGLRIEPHFTKATGGEAARSASKPDPLVGIESMGGLASGGKIRFPYGDQQSRHMSDLLISEFEQHPMNVTSDLLMAFWFVYLYSKKIRRRTGLRVIQPHIPAWIRRQGAQVNVPWVVNR